MNLLQRVTEPTVAVLRVLLAASDPVWGLKIIKETGLKAGSVYPILSRLEDALWISGEWEAEDERSGPRRRLYRFTEEGEREAVRVVTAFDEKRRAASRALGPAATGGLA